MAPPPPPTRLKSPRRVSPPLAHAPAARLLPTGGSRSSSHHHHHHHHRSFSSCFDPWCVATALVALAVGCCWHSFMMLGGYHHHGIVGCIMPSSNNGTQTATTAIASTGSLLLSTATLRDGRSGNALPRSTGRTGGGDGAGGGARNGRTTQQQQRRKKQHHHPTDTNGDDQVVTHKPPSVSPRLRGKQYQRTPGIPLAIFYNIYIPPAVSHSKKKAQQHAQPTTVTAMDLAMEQEQFLQQGMESNHSTVNRTTNATTNNTDDDEVGGIQDGNDEEDAPTGTNTTTTTTMSALPDVPLRRPSLDTRRPNPHALRIVAEQITQVRQSYAARTRNVTVYYTTVGVPLPTGFMQQLCAGNLLPDNATMAAAPGQRPRPPPLKQPPPTIHCVHYGHHTYGFEDLSLNRLYDYCQAPRLHANMTHVTHAEVAYMHSKGSFHPRAYNILWRKPLLAAILSSACLERNLHTCDVCSLQFYPIWGPFFPGNFWTASCDYIRKLHPYAVYSNRTTDMANTALDLRNRGELSMRFFALKEDKLTQGRFATEHWVASHPSLQPCQTSHQPSKNWWAQVPRKVDDTTFTNLYPSPVTTSYLAAGWFWNADPAMVHRLRDVQRSHKLRLQDYWLLGGQLWRWKTLYGALPSLENSGSSLPWAFRWFPDASFWQAAVQKYGLQAPEKVWAIVQATATNDNHEINEALVSAMK